MMLVVGGLVAQSCPTVCSPWTAIHQAPLSIGFPRQEYWREGKVPWQQFAGPEDIKNQVPHPYSRTCTLGATLGNGSVLRPDLRVYVCATSKKMGFWNRILLS